MRAGKTVIHVRIGMLGICKTPDRVEVYLGREKEPGWKIDEWKSREWVSFRNSSLRLCLTYFYPRTSPPIPAASHAEQLPAPATAWITMYTFVMSDRNLTCCIFQTETFHPNFMECLSRGKNHFLPSIDGIQVSYRSENALVARRFDSCQTDSSVFFSHGDY